MVETGQLELIINSYFVMLLIKFFLSFHHLDDTVEHVWQEICMKITQTNMEETEYDTDWCNSKQEMDSDQPSQNKGACTSRSDGSENCTL